MENAPALLLYLRDTLNYYVEQKSESFGLKIFNVDLSSWKLRLSDAAPVIWIPKTVTSSSPPREVFQILGDVIREQELNSQICIVMLDESGEYLRAYAESPLNTLVLLGDTERTRIMKSNRPSAQLLDIIFEQLPISLLAPYETTAPVIGSRFFGRDPEKSRITSNPDTNFIILGIRRIGKTSLLRETQRILSRRKDPPHILYLDCSDLNTTNDFVREIVRRLEPRELSRIELQKSIFYFPSFLERMRRKYRKKIVFILDEIDRLILAQRGDWELFRQLRTVSNSGDYQYILAGFREAERETNDINSPFYNFAQPIYLSEFTHQQAKDIIFSPMDNLRIHFQNVDEIVSRIFHETAGYPNLIQHYCAILLQRLEQKNERILSAHSLIDIYSDNNFQKHLISSFMSNTQNHEKAVVFSILTRADESWERGFTQSYIDASLRRHNITSSFTSIDNACNILKLGGFLRQKGQDYFFSSPIFVKVLLNSYDPDFLLRKVKEEGL